MPKLDDQDPSNSRSIPKLVTLTRASDFRGSLVAIEHPKELPFQAKRTFFIFDVPSQLLRGEHAHFKCEQFLVCVRGSITAVVDNGFERKEYLLNSPEIGLYMPPMIWGTQYGYSEDAILVVFASHTYSNDDYIREYDEYLRLIKNG